MSVRDRCFYDLLFHSHDLQGVTTSYAHLLCLFWLFCADNCLQGKFCAVLLSHLSAKYDTAVEPGSPTVRDGFHPLHSSGRVTVYDLQVTAQ